MIGTGSRFEALRAEQEDTVDEVPRSPRPNQLGKGPTAMSKTNTGVSNGGDPSDKWQQTSRGRKQQDKNALQPVIITYPMPDPVQLSLQESPPNQLTITPEIPQPIIIKPPHSFPYETNHQVPWNSVPAVSRRRREL